MTRPFNALHILALDSRGISSKASYIEVCCNRQVEKLTDVTRGKVTSKRTVTLVGCEFASGILLLVKDKGTLFDTTLGTISIQFDLLDLENYCGVAFRRWVSVLNTEALCVGHLLLELTPDSTYQFKFKVLRVEDPENNWRFSMIKLNVRDKEFKTKLVDGDDQVWNEDFSITISNKETLKISHVSDELLVYDSMGVANLNLQTLQAAVGQEQRVDLMEDGQRSGTLVYIVNYDLTTQTIPIRVVKGLNLEKTDLEMPGDPYVILKIGSVEFRTNVRETDNPEWEDEFVCTVEPHFVVEIIVKDEDLTFDDIIGTASMSGKELLAKKGSIFTVPIRNSKNRDAGSIILAVAVPFGYELNQRFMLGTNDLSSSSSKLKNDIVINTSSTGDYLSTHKNSDLAYSPSVSTRYVSPFRRSEVVEKYIINAPITKLGVSSADERYASYRCSPSLTYPPYSMPFSESRHTYFPTTRHTYIPANGI